MKKSSLILILFLIFVLPKDNLEIFPFNFVSSTQPDVDIKPQNSKSKTVLMVSGKKRIYYPLSTKPASTIIVKGPGELTIITRAIFTKKEKKSFSYKVYYSIDGLPKKEKKFNKINKSKEAFCENDSSHYPGTGEKIILKLEKGNHTIKVWSDNENPTLIARYLFKTKKEKKTDWSGFTPYNENQQVYLTANNKEVKYYRFSQDKPLKVQINGPTSLKVLTRIENHCFMKGRINYRLQVKQDGKIKNTYQLCSVRSETTSYKNDGSKIPGKAKEIVIEVPIGFHTYEIIPLDKDKSTVLGRIMYSKEN